MTESLSVFVRTIMVKFLSFHFIFSFQTEVFPFLKSRFCWNSLQPNFLPFLRQREKELTAGPDEKTQHCPKSRRGCAVLFPVIQLSVILSLRKGRTFSLTFETLFSFQISSGGLITFAGTVPYSPESVRLQRSSVVALAPYWSNVDGHHGRVYYSVRSDFATVQRAENDLRRMSPAHANSTVSHVLVVTWINVRAQEPIIFGVRLNTIKMRYEKQKFSLFTLQKTWKSIRPRRVIAKKQV